jgi:2-C-methyl-D-erythritol 4-phosphate cytidylyltransferase
MSHTETATIIPAAGSGERLGIGTPKALVEVDGITLIERAVASVARVSSKIVIAAPARFEDTFQKLFSKTSFSSQIQVVTGGSTRSKSVANALAILPKSIKYVLIHDAARAFAPASLAERVLAQLLAGEQAVIPAVEVIDTIKSVDNLGYVLNTPERNSLRAVQTPQGFTLETIIAAHATGDDATDDAALVSKLGLPVKVIPGDAQARKITTRDDLAWANELVGQR